jgi:hypothetical protein
LTKGAAESERRIKTVVSQWSCFLKNQPTLLVIELSKQLPVMFLNTAGGMSNSSADDVSSDLRMKTLPCNIMTW